jgi:putative sigma-54 modulation protein
MPFRVSGRNIDIGEALRSRVNARVAEALSKYFDGGYSGHVTVGKEAFGFRTECVVHLDSGTTLHTEAIAADAYTSADAAALRIEKRLRRYKSRLKEHSRHGELDDGQEIIMASSYVIEAPQEESNNDDVEFSAAIIAESATTLKRFSVREAVLELDMTGARVVVFRHGGHGRINLVYRRADGNIGWIDPPAVPSTGH